MRADSLPVICGVGQIASKHDDAPLVSALDLIAAAVERACADARIDASAIAGVYVVPPTVFSRSNAASELAERLPFAPGPRTVGRFSGGYPQRLIAAACDAITAGELDVAVVCGGIADASIRRARRRGETPPGLPASGWSQGSAGPGDVPDRNDAIDSYVPEMAAGIGGPPEIFALIESAIAAGAGRSPAAQRKWLGRAMAPFTAVAAQHPDLAWFPSERTPDYISNVRPDNRMIAEPYPKLMTSFPIVDQAAAIVIARAGAADRLGVPAAPRVYVHSLALCRDPAAPSRRDDMRRSAALDHACRAALAQARASVADIGAFDLYSCFPAAVQMATAALGLDMVSEPRPLTATGGLPYFGGPGANYGTHSVAAIVERCRRFPGELGLSVGLGGFAGDFSVGVYSTAPPANGFGIDHGTDVTATLELGRPPVDLAREGEAEVVAHTVVHGHEGPVRGCAIVQFADGTRSGARTASAAQARELSDADVVGTNVRVRVADGVSLYSV